MVGPVRALRFDRASAIKVATGLGALFALLLFACIIERVVYSGQVLPGVEIEGVDAEGKGFDDVDRALARLAGRLEDQPIEARASATDLAAHPSALALDVETDVALEAARRTGRSRNPFDAVAGFVLRRVRHEEVDVAISYSPERIEGLLDGWQDLVDDGVQEGDLVFDGSTVTVLEPRAGTSIVRSSARARLVAMIRSTVRRRVALDTERIEPEVALDEVEALAVDARRLLLREYVVTGTIEPNETPSTDPPSQPPIAPSLTISPDDIARALDATIDDGEMVLDLDPTLLLEVLGDSVDVFVVPARPASFEVQPDNSVAVVASVDGRELNLNRVADNILAERRAIAAPLRRTRPEHDTEWAEKLGIVEMVSSFTTHHPCCAERVKNIHTAAQFMDGTVVEPGEEFSLNDVVGPRTPERGFVAAPVFYGEFTEDFGGGVSQIATTTYNAAFWGGYEIVAHKPHSIYFSRYPMGREATVNYPALDLKFRNDSKHGVLVKTSFSDTSITISLYGDLEGKEVREENADGSCSVGPSFDTSNEARCHVVLAERPIERRDIPCEDATPEVDPDGECATLEPGEFEFVAEGHIGYTVELFRVIRRPDQETVRERIRWEYQMYPDTFLVGEPEEPPPTTSTTAPPGGSTTTRPRAMTTTVP